MTTDAIRALFAYTDWANERMLAALEQLAEDDLGKGLGGSFASLRDTFAHILAAEWLWLERWQGKDPRAMPEWVAAAGLAELGERMRRTAQERQRRLARLTAEAAAAPATYRNLKGDVTWRVRVGDMLLHVANHSTYHRGQLASKLRQLGVVPPATDLLIYASEP